jgi:hypothetical protein
LEPPAHNRIYTSAIFRFIAKFNRNPAQGSTTVYEFVETTDTEASESRLSSLLFENQQELFDQDRNKLLYEKAKQFYEVRRRCAWFGFSNYVSETKHDTSAERLISLWIP